jgi:hypothetical protein
MVLEVNLLATDPDIYIGKHLTEAKTLIARQIVLTFFLAALAYIAISLVGKMKELIFLQALLLVATTGSWLLNSFGPFIFLGEAMFYQLPMLSFINALLLGSILACLICASNYYSKGKLDFILQAIKSKLVKDVITEKSQYLSSYLLFLASSNLLYWSILFKHTLHDLSSFNVYNLAYLLFIALSAFLAYRFLRSAASFNLTSENHTVLIPLTPIIVYNIYLGSAFSVLSLSWTTVKSQSFFYKLFAVCINPTVGITYF